MRTRMIGRWVLLGLLTCAVASPALAQPPELNIPDVALRAGLLDSHRPKFVERITYWRDMLVNAAGPSEVLEAREGLVTDFEAEEGLAYRRMYAEVSAEILPPGLEVSDPLKQVNLALAIRRMESVMIRPALSRLVRSGNPAVRFLGWHGYKGIQSLLLAQGSRRAKELLDDVEQRLPEETDPLLRRAIYEVLRFRRGSAAILPTTIEAARSRAFRILNDNWLAQCRVLAGDGLGSIDAVGKALGALGGAVQAIDEPQRAEAAQMLLDLMYAAARSYKSAVEDGSKSLRLESEALLTDAERILQSVTGREESRVSRVLGDSGLEEPQRGELLLVRILEWVRALEDLGVQNPEERLKTDQDDADEES